MSRRRMVSQCSVVTIMLLMAACGASDVSRNGLPALDLPSPRGGDPGLYGWTSPRAIGDGRMHWVKPGREVAAMGFAADDSCFARSRDVVAVPVTVAGYDGAYFEPHEPAVFFNNDGDEVTRAYELQIGSGTLCAYVTWHPTTTALERDAALGILDSLRAEQLDDGRIRIVFTLTDRWDTG